MELDVAVLCARHNIALPPDELVIQHPLRSYPPGPPVQIPVSWSIDVLRVICVPRSIGGVESI